jgi:hypothetical protein
MIKLRNIGKDTVARDFGQWLEYDLVPGSANDFVLAVQNPYNDKDLLISEVIVDVQTAGGTAGAVMNMDVAANNTSAANDTIFDGLTLNTATLYSSRTPADTGTNGDEKIKLWNKAGGTNDYLVGQVVTEKCDNLVGKVHVRVRERT